MYLEFYGLREPPFSITPDPRFVYLSERHRDALAHLLYGIGQGGGGGFVQLTGEVGTGKTTLCRLLLEQLPENARVALVLNPKLSPVELLEAICEELRLDISGAHGSLKGLVDRLNAYLLDAYAQGLRIVLIIDEAQELSREALEQVRLLTNLETATQKLLQIILLGQPELRDMLDSPDLRQLAQRITARYHLTPLSTEETDAYVRHRLAVAGCTRQPFSKLALRRLHQHSGGVPRLINVIAERALIAGYAREQSQISEALVQLAAREALSHPIRRIPMPQPGWVVAAVLAVILLAFWFWPRSTSPELPGNDTSIAAGVDSVPARSVPFLDAEALDLRLAEARATEASAWNRLLALWLLRADEVDAEQATQCPQEISAGIYCLRSSGNLDKLAAIGRPVIVPLRGESGTSWAVLLGVDVLRVRLGMGGDSFDIDRRQLERIWNGEFVALWRAQPRLELPLRRGDRGAGVDWLHARLVGDGQGRPLVGPALYDDDTVAAVRRLQTAHGLQPDGILGLETLLALTGEGEDGPLLRRRL